jgi:hypothetical protein
LMSGYWLQDFDQRSLGGPPHYPISLYPAGGEGGGALLPKHPRENRVDMFEVVAEVEQGFEL